MRENTTGPDLSDNSEELNKKLPLELQRFDELLSSAYQWNENKDIICFKMLQRNSYIPFYLDFPLVTPQNIKDMLDELKEEPIYNISNLQQQENN